MAEYAPLEAILRLCAAAAPVPWYPRNAAAKLGMTEPDLIAFVEQLRGGGLIARTDAVAGYGRGYVLTPLGQQALQDPGDLEWLRRGEIPPHKAPPADDRESAPAPAVSERERAVRMSLLAPFTPRVTQVLVGINVAVFVWGVYLAHRPGGNLESVLLNLPEGVTYRTGGVKATDIMEPGWGLLRLLTCCFVHAGLIHAGANIVSLYMVGPLIERMWGHVRYLVIYLVAGFGGSCAAMVLKPEGGKAMVVGASGALWGLLAALVVWIVLNRRHMPRRLFSSWAIRIGIVIIINVVLTHSIPRISAEGHYGGAAAGAACAVLLHFTRFGPAALRAVATAAVAALPLFGLYAVTHPGRYNPEWDRLQWRDRYLTPARDAIDDSAKILKHSPADLLIRQDPQDRDEEKRKEVLAKYDEAIAGLRTALDLIPSTPFHEPKVEEARQTGREFVEARLELWQWEERALKDGEAPLTDKKFRELDERVKKLSDEWDKVQAAH